MIQPAARVDARAAAIAPVENRPHRVMIEFKAECGHTVRARDEDAGGVVRCSYCGQNANVPIGASHELDFVFEEAHPPAEPEGGRRRRRGRRKPESASRSPRPGEFDPFAWILRLCYAAVLIIIVVVVGRKFVIPMFADPQKRAQMLSGTGPSATASPQKADSVRPPAPRRGPGLIREARLSGLYVASTPPGAWVYCVEESKAPGSGRVYQVPGSVSARTPGEVAHAGDGSFVVEVAFPWNDPHLSDPNLPNYRNYMEFRRKIERASNDQRKHLVEEYFVPDEASAVFVDQTEDQIFIVRQYRGVIVRSGQSKGVRALFLPKLYAADRKMFLTAPLVAGYIPTGKNYDFDEKHVRGELAYYGVAEEDQPVVLEALARIGVMPYMTGDGRVRMFKIDLHDGVFATRMIRETS